MTRRKRQRWSNERGREFLNLAERRGAGAAGVMCCALAHRLDLLGAGWTTLQL
jgi:hypothetical protein